MYVKGTFLAFAEISTEINIWARQSQHYQCFFSTITYKGNKTNLNILRKKMLSYYMLENVLIYFLLQTKQLLYR